MLRILRNALLSALLLPALTQVTTTPASAAGCNPAFAAHGYIGDKFNDFGGSGGALGCPTSNELGMSASTLFPPKTPYDGKYETFQHGSISWYPALGPKATLSAWYNGGNRIHFDFSDLAPYPPGFHVLVQNGAQTATQSFYYSGGPGHNRDIALAPGLSFQNVLVSVFACTGAPTAASCGPHLHPAQKIGGVTLYPSEDAADAPHTIFASLNQGMIAGSQPNNLPPVAVDPDMLEFDTPYLTFASGVAADAYANVKMYKNGNCIFTTHFHNSGSAPYDDALSMAIVASNGKVFEFDHKGRIDGHAESDIVNFFGGSENVDDDTSPSKTDADIANNWHAIVMAYRKHGQGAAIVHANVNTDIHNLIEDVISDGKTLSAEYGEAEQVISVFAA